MRGESVTKMLRLFETESLMDGYRREAAKSDLEGQRSRFKARENKMSSVALMPFFMELLLPQRRTGLYVCRNVPRVVEYLEMHAFISASYAGINRRQKTSLICEFSKDFK